MMPRYSLSQIVLHWAVAVLIPIQYWTGGSIERTHHAVHMGLSPDPWDVIQHQVHNYTGITIGALMVARFSLRVIHRSASGHPAKSPVDRLARAMHVAFYAAVIAQAAMGFVASYFWFGIAPVHVLGSRVILALLALHIVAAAWHTFVWRDETVDRMLFPRRSAS
ncbi:cytochrome b561 [Rhizobium tibeticum]|uniref:Cytochrome b-562 n=1 Tax=Rhizobium tibeticum TaxID=501024 RepID=A0A1H8RI57_9HYPH|nr:cytochrome b/b6 domain-containing protein [Rhizobium tibeticum]MDP9809493.1 cytochrome b561 [Rhizobium tibeticum]SEI06772.1 Cytochrome b-562 [Rhizobium tibeticum]SEO66151.1 cytochrome b561 [Rhizobium tibeticum]